MSDRDGIQKLGPQRYRVWWVERRTGKRRSKVVRGPLEDARDFKREVEASQLRGEYVSPASDSLDAYLESWLRGAKLRGMKQSTHDRYTSLLAPVRTELGGIRLQDLTLDHLDDYYLRCLQHERTRLGKDEETGIGRRVSPNTIRKRHQAVKLALSAAVKRRLLAFNPADQATPPAESPRHTVSFTQAEAAAVLENVTGTDLELPVRIALSTGLRLGEVLGLRWRSIDLDGRKLTVEAKVAEASRKRDDGSASLRLDEYGKTASSRGVVSFGAGLAEALKRHRKEQAEQRLSFGAAWENLDLILCTPSGGLLRPTDVSGAFTAVLRPLESTDKLTTSGATFHTLRHTHASLLLADGKPVHEVSRRLRHRSIQVTLDYYAHVIPGRDEALADDFENLLASRDAHVTHTFGALAVTPEG